MPKHFEDDDQTDLTRNCFNSSQLTMGTMQVQFNLSQKQDDDEET